MTNPLTLTDCVSIWRRSIIISVEGSAHQIQPSDPNQSLGGRHNLSLASRACCSSTQYRPSFCHERTRDLQENETELIQFPLLKTIDYDVQFINSTWKVDMGTNEELSNFHN